MKFNRADIMSLTGSMHIKQNQLASGQRREENFVGLPADVAFRALFAVDRDDFLNGVGFTGHKDLDMLTVQGKTMPFVREGNSLYIDNKEVLRYTGQGFQCVRDGVVLGEGAPSTAADALSHALAQTSEMMLRYPEAKMDVELTSHASLHSEDLQHGAAPDKSKVIRGARIGATAAGGLVGGPKGAMAVHRVAGVVEQPLMDRQQQREYASQLGYNSDGSLMLSEEVPYHENGQPMLAPIPPVEQTPEAILQYQQEMAAYDAAMQRMHDRLGGRPPRSLRPEPGWEAAQQTQQAPGQPQQPSPQLNQHGF